MTWRGHSFHIKYPTDHHALPIWRLAFIFPPYRVLARNSYLCGHRLNKSHPNICTVFFINFSMAYPTIKFWWVCTASEMKFCAKSMDLFTAVIRINKPSFFHIYLDLIIILYLFWICKVLLKVQSQSSESTILPVCSEQL